MFRWLRVGTAAVRTLIVGLLAVVVVSAPEFLPELFVFDHPGYARGVLLIVTALAYGVLRVVGTHPALRPRYVEWLMSTPWTARMPLPLGPIHLSLGDLAAVTVLLLAAADLPAWVLLAIPLAAGAGYLFSLAVMLAMTGGTVHGMALVAGLALAFRVGASRFEIALVILALLYPLALHGIRRTLARFPWTRDGPFGRPLPETLATLSSPFLLSSVERQVLTARANAGWPHGLLAPRAQIRRIPAAHRALLALIGGWIFGCVAGAIPQTPDDMGPLVAFSWIVIGMALITRVVAYCGGCHPPISLGGRLATGRLVIPRYDVVFIAPIAAIVARIAIRKVALEVGLPPDVAFGLSVGAALLILALAGPDLVRWRLTGHHRMAPTIPSAQRVTTG